MEDRSPRADIPLTGPADLQDNPMQPKDIYDDMPNGTAKRAQNRKRLAELQREGAARRARIAQVIVLEDLWHQVVQAHSTHLL
jgi:hypothetical protein